MKKYLRNAFEVEAVKYETSKGMEDGFMPWSSVVTTGWIETEGLVKIDNGEGILMCPFIRNRRGMIFLREGDYIIIDSGNEKHACGADKFPLRYQEIK